MPKRVSRGALLQCSYGSTASTLMIIPNQHRELKLLPMATIMDNKALVNVLPFGICSSLANPAVTGATAAAMGTLVPMPCVPVTTAPWESGSTTEKIDNLPALDETGKLLCAWGGVISIVNPGQYTVEDR